MIDNLKLEITSTELKALVEGRMKYHTHKATVLEEEMGRLGTVLDDLDDEAEEIGKYTSNSGNNNPVDNLRGRAKVHRDRATYFKFFSEHIIPNEKYVLTQADLCTIEVVGSRGW
jgi:hypothetical protein